MKGRKGNRALRERRKDPASRSRQPRKPSAVAAAELRAAEAERRAAQFAATQTTFAMPPFMAEERAYAGAAGAWRFYEPLLKERNFWQPQFIATFAGFCIYYDEFLAADREVKAKGWGVEGKSTSGGARFWSNPAVDVRDHAFARIMELSSRFGFTTLDLAKLERESAAASSSRLPAPKPAGAELPLDQSAESEPATTGPGGPGALSAFDSVPPGGRPN